MIATVSLSDQVYRLLLERILAGAWPPGTALREPALATELGVSRTPIREALGRLAGRGLVVMQTNRGAVVRELDRDALRQIYQIRGALEGLAASLAAGKITAGDAAAMRSLAQAVPAPEAEGYAEACWTFDVALHGLIAERSGNALLAAEIRRNVDLVQLVRTRVGARPGFLAQAYQQHLEILAAVESGDRRAARQTMTRHIRDAARVAARVALVELKSRSVRRSSSR